MPTPLPDIPAGSSSGTLSSLGTMLPLLIVIVGAVVMLVRKVLGGGFDTAVDWAQGLRRVTDTRRDGEVAALRAEMEGAQRVQEASRKRQDAQIAALQVTIAQHERVINDLRYDLSDHRAYGWESYTEIRRLDPDTTFPRPPALRSARHPDTLADVQPAGD